MAQPSTRGLVVQPDTRDLGAAQINDEQFLELVGEYHGLRGDALSEFARAWGVASLDIKAIEARLDAKDATKRALAEAAINRSAYGVAHALRLAAGVIERTEAIQTAEAEQLNQFLEFYEQQTDELYVTAADLPDGPERLEFLAKFERLAGFWWETREALGLLDLLVVVGDPKKEEEK